MKTVITARAFVACIIAIFVCGIARGQNASPVPVDQYQEPIKLACVGDSITKGVGAAKGESWPDQIARMLGEKWDVKNFGRSGATLLKNGNSPYQKGDILDKALALNPDVVVIMLGTNDTKPENWRKKDQFEEDYIHLITQFAHLSSKPRIYICYPAYIARKGEDKINEAGTLAEIPMIDKVAKETQCGVIDVHGALLGKDELIPDGVHPNSAGATLIAKAVFRALTGKDAPAEPAPSNVTPPNEAAAGPRVEKFSIDGNAVILKVPLQAAPGNPWLWIGEFPGVLRKLEDNLVSRGWHVAYVGVKNQFGSPEAMGVWEKLYSELHDKRSLSARPALLGISRGGLYVNAWTRLHPDRVSVLYLDNGVCDIRSWPAGFQLTMKGKGSDGDLKTCKRVLGYASDEDLMAKAVHPTDNMEAAIQNKVFLIDVYGTADGTVPHDDNGKLMIDFWAKTGGRYKAFPKEGGDHHPHGLPDPLPLVELICAEAAPHVLEKDK